METTRSQSTSMKTWVWQNKACKRWPCKGRGPLLALLFVFEMLQYCAISLSRHENNRKWLFEFFYWVKWGGGSCHSQLSMAKCHYWSESIFEDLRLYWITAVQPPLAAHGCQRHLKETSIGRIGMTSWKRGFLAINQGTEPFTSGKYQFTGKGVMII